MPSVLSCQRLGHGCMSSSILGSTTGSRISRQALGLSQLQRLDEIVVERNQQLQRYRDLLSDLPVQLLECPKDVVSSVHLAVIRLQQVTAEQHRQVFEGLAVRRHWRTVALQSGAFAALLYCNGI